MKSHLINLFPKMRLSYFINFASLLLIYSKLCKTMEENSPPHIIFILADDLGWNDISLHGSPQIPTPNIDALASSSVILKNYYADRLCTPSRAALLTGKYASYLGLHKFVARIGERTAIPLNEILLPQHLQRLGYRTHMVGKWNVGYMSKEYTPIYRGFETFFGFYNGMIDYYSYRTVNGLAVSYSRTSIQEQINNLWDNSTNYGPKNLVQKSFHCIDLQNGIVPVVNISGIYLTDILTQKAEELIKNHNNSEPLFLYLAHIAPHNSFLPDSLQAPPELIQQFRYIKNEKRRKYAGTLIDYIAMVASLDLSIGKIFKALHDKDMLHNSIVIFSSDNGGDSTGLRGGSASNWPLRSEKEHWYEGGIKIPGFIWSPLFNLTKTTYSKHLMHISDWLPTLYRAAGGLVKDLGDITGYNMWESFTNASLSPRKELLHYFDPLSGQTVFRSEKLKLIHGRALEYRSRWYGTSGREDFELPPSMDKWVFQNGSVVKDILQDIGQWLVKEPDTWRTEAILTCKQPPPEDDGGCNPRRAPCLFDIQKDPCEYRNLASRYPNKVKQLLKSSEKFKRKSLPSQTKPSDNMADPSCHKFMCVPWLDKEYRNNCNILSF